MKKIFISHAWTEAETYVNFVRFVDELIGVDNWENVSIPREDALELSGLGKDYDELRKVENQIVHVRSKLKLPGLSRARCCIVYDSNGNRREVETAGSLTKELRLLEKRRDSLVRPSSNNIEAISDYPIRLGSKGVAKQLAMSPDLSNAIRRRVMVSDLVFVLVTRILNP